MTSTSRLRLLAEEIATDDTLPISSGRSSTSGTQTTTRRKSEAHSARNSDHPDSHYDGGDSYGIGSRQVQAEGIDLECASRSTNVESSKHQSTPVELSLSPTISSGGSMTSPTDSNLFLKLQRQRLKNERLRSSLEQEMQTMDWLQKEEDSLRQKISRAHEVIGNLKEQSESLESTYTGMEKLYRANSEKLKVLQHGLRDIKDQWEKESAQFNMYSSQLRKLQQKLPGLTDELGRVANETTMAAKELVAKVSYSQVADENRGHSSEQNVTAATQTKCDMNTISELESIERQLSTQRIMMKQVRETVELLRRCP